MIAEQKQINKIIVEMFADLRLQPLKDTNIICTKRASTALKNTTGYLDVNTEGDIVFIPYSPRCEAGVKPEFENGLKITPINGAKKE